MIFLPQFFEEKIHTRLEAGIKVTWLKEEYIYLPITGCMIITFWKLINVDTWWCEEASLMRLFIVLFKARYDDHNHDFTNHLSPSSSSYRFTANNAHINIHWGKAAHLKISIEILPSCTHMAKWLQMYIGLLGFTSKMITILFFVSCKRVYSTHWSSLRIMVFTLVEKYSSHDDHHDDLTCTHIFPRHHTIKINHHLHRFFLFWKRKDRIEQKTRSSHPVKLNIGFL